MDSTAARCPEGAIIEESIFRLLLGQALMARGDLEHCNTWGVKGDASKASVALNMKRVDLAAAEEPIERAVTDYITAMPFLWIGIDDEPGPASLRGFVERNSIALLNNHERTPLDPPSSGWLGYCSDRELVRGSGLWNQRHVEETHDPHFLNVLEKAIQRECSMIRFCDDDLSYLTWTTAHPDGFVLNVRRVADPVYVVLHRANCGSVSNDKQRPGAFTGRDYRKICAASVDRTSTRR